MRKQKPLLSMWAVVFFDENRNADLLNEYDGGTYNSLVTSFEPDDLNDYMHKKGNIIYDKAKDAASRGYDRLWSSHTRKTPFAEESIPDLQREVKEKITTEEALAADMEDSDGMETYYGNRIKFSRRVTDKTELDFLDRQEKIKTYKTMQLVDGKLYPPMAAVVAGSMEPLRIQGLFHRNPVQRRGPIAVREN